jgi:hypothetical protein
MPRDTEAVDVPVRNQEQAVQGFDRRPRLPIGTLLKLKRWNTPTVYNGWEQITQHNVGEDAFNVEETRDFMPRMGPMVGHAVTVVCEPSAPAHRQANPNASNEYHEYLAGVPDPKIVVVQDLDKPAVVGSFWGEVNAKSLRLNVEGCSA